MLVVDASCLYEVVASGPSAERVRERFEADGDHVAPHLIDVEVLSVIRGAFQRSALDRTAAEQAVEDLATWPGERVGHRPLLPRAWELRDTVRAADAVYVALAEALDVPLLTLDRRLVAAPGPTCEFIVIDEPSDDAR